jgi:NAD(P)-dependent dehydrogenase (short-subunit alcohol dehydrogenase family)
MNTIVMTGGTSGLGEVARRFIQNTQHAAVARSARGGPLGAETLPLDLMRLENVRSFASAVDRELGPAQINALVLKTGLLFPNDDTRSADGFEATFAVNHLAHYLLLRLLPPRLAQGATVILTTSGTRDPAEKTIIAPPLHADARFLAHPERAPNRDPHPLIAGRRTYSYSKLCNALTARALAAHVDTTARRLTIIAYDPGHTPGTGLVRNENSVINFLWKPL